MTNVANCCQLLVYGRYIEGNNVKTELMMNEELSETTDGKDIFNLLDKFFKQSHLDEDKLVGCTTDGAPSMLSRKSGFQAYVNLCHQTPLLFTVLYTDLLFVPK